MQHLLHKNLFYYKLYSMNIIYNKVQLRVMTPVSMLLNFVEHRLPTLALNMHYKMLVK